MFATRAIRNLWSGQSYKELGLDVTSQLIGSGLSDCSISLVRGKHLTTLLLGQGFSATRIPTSSIMGNHPWPTGDLVKGFLSFCRNAVSVFCSPSQQNGSMSSIYSHTQDTLEGGALLLCNRYYIQAPLIGWPMFDAYILLPFNYSEAWYGYYLI